jgi:hypothetical protein
MRSIIYFWLLIVSQALALGQTPNSPKRFEVKFNKNVEFLGFAYFVGFEGNEIEKANKSQLFGGKIVSERERYRYGFRFYEQYKHHAENPDLEAAVDIASHLWLDYIIELLLQVDDFPRATLPKTIKSAYYRQFSEEGNVAEGKQYAVAFLNHLNAFYETVDFDQHLKNQAIYYKNALLEVQKNVPNAAVLDEMEQLYGQKLGTYTLVPSLTIPSGMGFGVGFETKGKKAAFNVFGAFELQNLDDTTQLNTGFDSPRDVQDKSVHEFGHSFVNHVIDAVPAPIISSKMALYEPIRQQMSAISYPNWKICLYEHFVRAGEVVIARRLGQPQSAEALYKYHHDELGFVYLPQIIQALEKNSQKSYSKLVADIIQNLH